MYAGSGPGSARERHFSTRGAQQAGEAVWHKLGMSSECAATFRIFIQQTRFDYCLTSLQKVKPTTPPSVII